MTCRNIFFQRPKNKGLRRVKSWCCHIFREKATITVTDNGLWINSFPVDSCGVRLNTVWLTTICLFYALNPWALVKKISNWLRVSIDFIKKLNHSKC